MRPIVTFSVLLVVCVGAIAVASAFGASSNPGIHALTITATTDEFFPTTGPGTNLGDVYGFHAAVTRKGVSIGEDGGTCQIVSVLSGGGEALCHTAVVIRNKGQIMISGLVHQSSNTDGGRFTLPITGGTGVFRNIVGYAVNLPTATEEIRKVQIIYRLAQVQ